jgi:hypothetical protein
MNGSSNSEGQAALHLMPLIGAPPLLSPIGLCFMTWAATLLARMRFASANAGRSQPSFVGARIFRTLFRMSELGRLDFKLKSRGFHTESVLRLTLAFTRVGPPRLDPEGPSMRQG